MATPFGPVSATANYSDNDFSGLFESGFVFAQSAPLAIEITYGTPAAAGDIIHDLYCPAGQSINFQAPGSKFPNVFVTRVRFKNATGTTATASGYFNESRAPGIIAAIGGQAVLTGTLNIQHNDVLVGTENTLDFEDGANLTWTITDDAAHTRVKVTPTVTGLLPGGSNGQILGYSGGWAGRTPASFSFNAGTQSPNTNGVSQMAGWGASTGFTPQFSGRMELVGHIQCSNTSGAQVVQGQGYFGTGGAPAQGAALAGTAIGINIVVSAGNDVVAAIGAIATGLTVGTAYWFDFGYLGNTANVVSGVLFGHEF